VDGADRALLSSLRLASCGRAAALVTDRAEVCWLVAPEIDAVPALWSLLDREGAAARWVGAHPVTEPGGGHPPVGPVVRAVVEIDGRRVDTLDGLFVVDDGVVLVRLVRLVRSAPDGPAIEHAIELGGLDSAKVGWRDGSGILDGTAVHLEVHDRATSRFDGATARTEVRPVDGTWTGLALGFGCRPPSGGVAAWHATLLATEHALDAELERARAVGPHQPRIATALRVLRACTDPRTGGVVASPTTSLPEAPGFDRQFDYRYSWIRDSSLAASVCAQVGLPSLADEALDFLHRAVDADGSSVCPVRTTRWEPTPVERELDRVAGHLASTPVRLGNAAGDQQQFDAIGAYVDAVWTRFTTIGRLHRSVWASVQRIAEEIAATPDRPSNGIWEVRDPIWAVSEDIGRWLVLDRALRLNRWRTPWHRRPAWVAERARLRDRVTGAISDDGTLPLAHDQPGTVDAAGLGAVIAGLLDQKDPRAARLVEATAAALGDGPFLRRYSDDVDDGFQGREGAFLPMSWWLVSALAIVGKTEEARARADALCEALPELLAEEVDAATGELRGNHPLVWSHMEAARALHLIAEADVRDRWREPGVAAARLGRLVIRRMHSRTDRLARRSTG
jgi:hypothetical protein